MVIVNLKLTDIGTIEIAIRKPETLATLLKRCEVQTGKELGGVIAIRRGKVLKESDLVGTEDEIDVFPAISGG